ncbi:hypothetical protein GCM10007416_05470 [Kroppenstedtia guangzhouensis]|uniref:Uncharacterized protein n=1 Tax=Kroppenstedtia guangzhouensis TaxID=1274356 RepID=A0ABQ1G1I9_9BACL|nr:hypothetical protein GCM10007416_05470 [Kroppenstedtia guangzhouensis]
MSHFMIKEMRWERKVIGIRTVIRKKRPFYGWKAPNRLNQEFTAEASLRRLVTDIAYVRIRNDFAYLSVVQDLSNSEVLVGATSEERGYGGGTSPLGSRFSVHLAIFIFPEKNCDLSPVNIRKKSLLNSFLLST